MLCNAGDLLHQHASSSTAAQVAVVDGARRAGYRELLRRARSMAGLLKERGIRRGDRVAIFLPRSIDAVTALFGTWFAGGVAVIVNDRLRTQQVRHIVEHSEAGCVVTDSQQLRAVPQLPREQVISVDAVESWPAPCAPDFVIGADLALLIYTSGSTGVPKGVMLTHDNVLSGARIVTDYLHLTARDVILSVLPFSFDYGLNQLMTSLLVGGTLVIQRSLFPRDICQSLVKERITGLAGVPTLWLQLIGRHSPFLRTSCPELRYITNSGGRLPEHAVRLIRAAHPHVQIYLMYGLTEAFRSTYLPPDEVDRRPSSIGKAIPNVEILVINDDGTRCQPGEVGELVHRGANVSRGYWRDPDSTSRVLKPHPLEECRNGNREMVVFSGDLVTTDADGYLYFLGRKDKQIKSRGVRVSPEEIESCIYSSTLVAHVVSFAVAGEGGENDIVAVVVPRDPASFHEDALDEFCKREMPEYMWPRVIWRLDLFPLTTSGKPDRCRIQQMYDEHRESAGTAPRAARTA
jgi:acyl-CoA ligase (AMP-forming) (exosortase A-associated)